jgi:cysteine desulfurase family protein (TIGR01976 family)
MPLDLTAIRSQFPALSRNCIFLDNPAGTQVARTVLDRMKDYLVEHNANHEGAFATSRESDALVEEARMAAADFLNARDPQEIVFGPNMTSLTFNLSRSLVRNFNPGDEIVVTRLDHDANITPWVMAAQDRSCNVVWVDFHPEDGTLNMDEMQAAIERKPRLVAVGYASNALGTINPVTKITQMAHEAGSLVYIDAVQFAPHGPIDVQRLGCDFLVCSSYKFFGPHMGVLYGRYNLLDSLTAYRVRPAPKDPPGKFETGTGNFEGMCGVLGALEYIEWVGETFGAGHAERYAADYTGRYAADYTGRRLRFKLGMTAIRSYEFELSRILLDILMETPRVTVYGITDTRRLEERVPTCAFTLEGKSPRQVAEERDEANIFVWDGNYYAFEVTTHLGLDDKGGMVRVEPVHYNTKEEIKRFGEDRVRRCLTVRVSCRCV